MVYISCYQTWWRFVCLKTLEYVHKSIINYAIWLSLMFIHSFSTTYPVQGHGWLEPPAVFGRWCTPRASHQSIAGLIHRNRQPVTHTLTPMGKSESQLSLMSMFLDCVGKQEYLESTHTCAGGTCKLHTKVHLAQTRIQTTCSAAVQPCVWCFTHKRFRYMQCVFRFCTAFHCCTHSREIMATLTM